MFSKIEKEHKRHLEIVFQELRAHKLLVNGKKSEFFLKEIHYLRHVIKKGGIRMDPAKIRAIQKVAKA